MLRCLITHPRSGSTLCMRILSSHPLLNVTSRTVIMGNMDTHRNRGERTTKKFIPDHSIFEPEHSTFCHPIWKIHAQNSKPILVSKEEFGTDLSNGTHFENECNFRMFPNDKAILDSRPIFLFRNPYTTFSSWLKLGWTDIKSFIECYHSLYRCCLEVKKVLIDTPVFTYNDIVHSNGASAKKLFKDIADYWIIPFDFDFNFNENFGETFIYWSKTEEENYKSNISSGVFNTIRTLNYISDELDIDSLTNGQKEIIDKAGLYSLWCTLPRWQR